MSRCKVTNCLISLHLLAHASFFLLLHTSSLFLFLLRLLLSAFSLCRRYVAAFDPTVPLPISPLFLLYLYRSSPRLVSPRHPRRGRYSPTIPPTRFFRLLSRLPSILFTLFLVTFGVRCCWSLTPFACTSLPRKEYNAVATIRRPFLPATFHHLITREQFFESIEREFFLPKRIFLFSRKNEFYPFLPPSSCGYISSRPLYIPSLLRLHIVHTSASSVLPLIYERLSREVTYVRRRLIKKTIERRIRVFRGGEGYRGKCLEIEFCVFLLFLFSPQIPHHAISFLVRSSFVKGG